jgi:hypothetical protein
LTVVKAVLHHGLQRRWHCGNRLLLTDVVAGIVEFVIVIVVVDVGITAITTANTAAINHH